jgi:hypothetical protein
MSDARPTGDTPRSIMNAVTNDRVASAVVPVLPDDQLDAVATKVRDAGVPHVQLLIPAGAAAFRSSRSFRVLKVLLSGDDAHLLVVSGDPQTLEAARQAGVDVMGLEAPRAPAAPRPVASPLATQPIDDRDAAFLRNLDQVEGGEGYPPGDRDADLYASLDDFSDTFTATPPTVHPAPPPRGEDLTTEPLPARPAPPARRPPPEEAMRRLSGDTSPDLARPRRNPRAERSDRLDRAAPVATPRAESIARPRSAGVPPVAPAPLPRDRGRRVLPEDEEFLVPERRRAISPNVIALLVIVGLLAAGLLWALTNRVTVAVSLPAGAVRQIPFEDEVIPLNPSAGGPNATAVQASSVGAGAEYTLTGQVVEETVSPVGRASGQVTIRNTVEQALPLPEGTEFIGQNAAGAEVRFVINQVTAIPPAVTTTTDAGRTTTYGEIAVGVTARSPGSASNVGENAIKQIVIPGQQPIVSDRSSFIIRHAPIGGGTEEPQRVVTEAEVQRVLGEALTNLYNTGLQALQAEASTANLAVDPTTVTPSIAQLASPESYEEPVVSPPIGSPVDPANPSFTVTIRTRFTALATPTDRSVARQLETVVPQHFSQRPSPPCAPAESQAVKDVSWSWDGERLAIDGAVECTPRREIPPEALASIRATLVGQSREAAEAGLRELQRQGVIGGYQLPDRQEMPPLELLIDVQVQQPVAGP